MPKKFVSKAAKKVKKNKIDAWCKRLQEFIKDHNIYPYERRVTLLDNHYLSEYEDGTVEVYASFGSLRPPLDYGYFYHLVLRGAHGTPIIAKWVYHSKETPLENVWKEACDAVDEIADEEVIDSEYLKSRGFVWD